MSAEVIDARFDLFLRAIRDTGDFAAAAAHAGTSVPEIEAYCKENAKYDLAVVECHLEWMEETAMNHTRNQLKIARDAHMKAYEARHPEG